MQQASSKSQLSCNMPLSSLKRVFFFADGDVETALSCPVASGVLRETVGAPLNDLMGKYPFDALANSSVGAQTVQTGQLPNLAWVAMGNIAPDETKMAQAGAYRTVVRPAPNPNTQKTSCWVLLYG
ncbi:MAG: hypothetical protein FWE60_05610 [Oscillospiraceae bacterium]|nr:hypothetical protein [Oscillospiraceae bacterium]